MDKKNCLQYDIILSKYRSAISHPNTRFDISFILQIDKGKFIKALVFFYLILTSDKNFQINNKQC